MAADDSLAFADGPREELDDALAALLAQAEKVRSTQGRLRALLAATQSVVEQIDLSTVLRRIVVAATTLVDAEYGALGVIAPERDALEEFVFAGLDEDEAAKIGHLPFGHGLLGALIADPRPIRIKDISHDERSAGFPAHHPAMSSFLGVPIRVRGEVFGNLYLTNHRDGGFTDEDEQLLAALATTAGFAIDNARLLDLARTREKWMGAAAGLSAALLASPTDTAFDLIASRIFELPGVDKVTVLLTDEDTGRLRIVAARGDDEAELRGRVVDVDDVCAGAVLEVAEASIIAHSQDAASDVLLIGDETGTGPALVAPMRTRSRLWGVVCIARKPSGRRLTQSEIESAADFVSRAGIALELAVAREESQRAMLADDRSRIARDLHDHVIQQLFGTGLSLQAVAASIPPGAEAQRLSESVEQLDDAIAQIRTVVFALSRRDETAIRHRIIDVVAEMSGSMRRPAGIRFSGPVDHLIIGDLFDDVVGVTRELLSNAIRHAHPDRISIELAVDQGDVVVTVDDDGVGIGDTPRRSGLDNLSHKAQRRGGTFTLESPGEGTRAIWRVPLPNPTITARKDDSQ
ncbi:GAF domain-containing protein [Microbacterium immunditiarum]|uniref:Signal transduction histidine kinase n=1 Tax=Microbacterium immunditiarum TaxID=337480 RepID=A0A7Y9GME7_9MICO|nr:GAF domain-containing protein [Microbacterium immunditiarum]NYE19172.1 signal transduction histidine kinase [Microbacterium immunditiarum]